MPRRVNIRSFIDTIEVTQPCSVDFGEFFKSIQEKACAGSKKS
jgi:hypothetical protein